MSTKLPRAKSWPTCEGCAHRYRKDLGSHLLSIEHRVNASIRRMRARGHRHVDGFHVVLRRAIPEQLGQAGHSGFVDGARAFRWSDTAPAWAVRIARWTVVDCHERESAIRRMAGERPAYREAVAVYIKMLGSVANALGHGLARDRDRSVARLILSVADGTFEVDEEMLAEYRALEIGSESLESARKPADVGGPG